jgi:hypothetical protein
MDYQSFKASKDNVSLEAFSRIHSKTSVSYCLYILLFIINNNYINQLPV